MSYCAKAHGELEGIDYQAERPLKAWKKPDILETMETWLRLDPPRLELATLALDELKVRGKSGRAVRLFQKASLEPIPWLAAARKLALAELPVSTDGRRRGRLYVILRDGYSEQNGFYGAYVGVTGKQVEDRFLEHRNGIHAARGLQVHGIELLYSLFVWANPVPGGRDERRKYETLLHKTLEGAIPRVTGDVVS